MIASITLRLQRIWADQREILKLVQHLAKWTKHKALISRGAHCRQQVDVILPWYCFRRVGKKRYITSYCSSASQYWGFSWTLLLPLLLLYLVIKKNKKHLPDTLNPNNPFIAVHFCWHGIPAEIVWPSWHLSEISGTRIPRPWNKHLQSSPDKLLTVGRKRMETEGVTDGRIESKLDLWGRRLTCHCRWSACLWANIRPWSSAGTYVCDVAQLC